MTNALSDQIQPVADLPEADTGPHRASERRLVVEVAKLEAELADLRGSGSVEATSRFLAMATETMDQAMNEARQDLERSRADAADLTASALAEVVEMKSQAEIQAAEVRNTAHAEATELKTRAVADAESLVVDERGRVADEIEALQEVRDVLEAERLELENCHLELRRRVQELSESMVSFMTTESLSESVAVLDTVSADAGATTTPFEPPASDRDPIAQSTGPGLFDPPTQSELHHEFRHEGGVSQVLDDQRFQAFIGGDDAQDKSRDWLLGPDRD